MKAAAFGDDEIAHLPSNGLRALATVGLLCRRRCRCMLSPPGGVLGKARGHVPCPPRAAASPCARAGPAAGGHAIANGYGQAAVPSRSHGAGIFPRCPLAASSSVHTLCKPAKVCYQFDKWQCSAPTAKRAWWTRLKSCKDKPSKTQDTGLKSCKEEKRIVHHS